MLCVCWMRWALLFNTWKLLQSFWPHHVSDMCVIEWLLDFSLSLTPLSWCKSDNRIGLWDMRVKLIDFRCPCQHCGRPTCVHVCTYCECGLLEKFCVVDFSNFQANDCNVRTWILSPHTHCMQHTLWRKSIHFGQLHSTANDDFWIILNQLGLTFKFYRIKFYTFSAFCSLRSFSCLDCSIPISRAEWNSRAVQRERERKIYL